MRKQWTDEMLKEEALKYNTKFEFIKQSHSAYECARSRGILSSIITHMVPTHGLLSKPRPQKIKWTEESLKREALKYISRSEFKKYCPGAYKRAKILGILDSICQHMLVQRRQWSDKQILESALLFKTRQEFYKGNRKAYDLAHRRGLIEKACSHMKATTRSSLMEQELMRFVLQSFPEAKTMRDHHVNIPGKPHIKRFEIDVFVQSCNKGIEFDGTYHHSFEMLKRSRKHWPDQDVLDYHQIKDGWFKSQGIEILHIKELDWISNKEQCLKTCLEFLSKGPSHSPCLPSW